MKEHSKKMSCREILPVQVKSKLLQMLSKFRFSSHRSGGHVYAHVGMCTCTHAYRGQGLTSAVISADQHCMF